MKDKTFKVDVATADIIEGNGILLVVNDKYLFISEQSIEGLPLKPVVVGEAVEEAGHVKGIKTVIRTPNDLLQKIVKFFESLDGQEIKNKSVENVASA